MSGLRILSLLLGSAMCLSACRQNGALNLGDYVLAYNVAVDTEEDDYDIFKVDLLSGEKTNITQNPDVAWTYLAYDDHIFFISDRDTCVRCYFLYEMNVNGEGVRKITDFPLKDSWMGVRKHGSELIVNPSSKVDSVFYIINREGRILEKMQTGLPFAADPAFSPDGLRITFRGAHKRSKREADFNEAIYVMNTDGTGLKKLSKYPEGDTTAPWYAYKAGPPRWHPTEDFISYQSFQDGKYSLYAVTPDASRQWKLTGNDQEEGWHDWSPDGRWLALEVFDSAQTKFDIMLMNWLGKSTRILTDHNYIYQQAPVFVRKGAP